MGVRKPKNIYIVGAQSTGKTTIVRALEDLWRRNEQAHGNEATSAGEQAHETSSQSANEASGRFWSNGGKDAESEEVSVSIPQPTYIREVARTVLKTLSITRDDVTNNPRNALHLQKQILFAQQKAEAAALSSGPSAWFVSDRSAIDPVVHAKDFVGEKEGEELLKSPEWEELGARMREGCVFVCEAGTEWLVDDGVRAMPASLEDWARIDGIYRETLEEAGVRFTVVPRDVRGLEERVELILRVWEGE